jgi:hypothetical protein
MWRTGIYCDDHEFSFENYRVTYEIFLSILTKLENDPMFTRRRITLFQEALEARKR